MATKKAATVKVADVQGDIQHVFNLCLQYQLIAANGALLPAFIGPTGSGKTQRALAGARSMPLEPIRWLLGQDLPEDVGGYPRVIEARDKCVAEFILTKVVRSAIDKPMFLLIDEVDKVRPEVVATVLTLMADRTIRGEMLHPGTVMAVAGQPVDASGWLADETNKALSARCVWLPVQNDWDYVSEKVRLPLEWLHSASAPSVTLPVLPANARTVERAMGFLTAYATQLSVADRQLFLYGCMAPSDADSLLAELGESCWLNLEAAVKADPMRVVETLSTNELATQVYVFLRHCTSKEAIKAALVKVLHKGTEEHRRLFMTNMIEGFKRDAPNVGDTQEIAPGVDDIELTEMFRDAIVAAKKATEGEPGTKTPTKRPPKAATSKSGGGDD